MPRRTRRDRRRRKSAAPPVEVVRELSTEQMAARLVSKGLASPQILNFHRWRTPETTDQLSDAVRAGTDRRNDR